MIKESVKKSRLSLRPIQYMGVISGQFGIESFYKPCPMSIGQQSIGSIVPNGASRGLACRSLRGVSVVKEVPIAKI